MKKEVSYNEELKEICSKMKKSFAIKINSISALKTKKCLKRLIKLNKKTNNENIDELIHIIGRSRMEYKKYCRENNYISDPYVNQKIREAYSKLSRKSMKIKTTKKNIKNNKSTIQIEYNSDRGSYVVNTIENDNIVKTKEYLVRNIKNLEAKRKGVLRELRRWNYGINIFKELEIDKDKFYKVNPDIIHILLSEGKVDYAKMYIKEVVGGETMHLPFSVKYVLNANVKKGKFSPEENRNMKKMARADRLANDLVIFSDKKKKEIAKPEYSDNNVKVKFVETIKRNMKIANIKESKEKKQKNKKMEIMERSNKIRKIKNKKLHSFADRINVKNSENTSMNKTSDHGCKIYNVDRKNNDIDELINIILESKCNCKVYNVDRRNIKNNIYSDDGKVVAHSER